MSTAPAPAPATTMPEGLARDLAVASLDLARRFAAGATMWCVSPAWPSHAHHLAVEFVHPVIVGKRALPAVVLPLEPGVGKPWAWARPGDVVVVIAEAGHPAVAGALSRVPAGVTTLWMGAGPRPPVGVADHVLWLSTHDQLTASLGFVRLYHLLWELAHVCFEHPGLVSGGEAAGGASRPPALPARDEPTSFLYPFIDAEERDAGTLLVDLASSARAKWAESERLRRETLGDNRDGLASAAGAVADRLGSGGRLFSFGNGGSATDAGALAQLFSRPPWGTPAPARSLADDQAVLTALSNDIGFEVVFSRQLIAHRRPGDVAVAFSTSGGSANVLSGLAEAHRRGLLTVGFAGYDGGRMGTSPDLDQLVVARSDSVHRIQEAQTAAAHALWALVQAELGQVAPEPPGAADQGGRRAGGPPSPIQPPTTDREAP